MKLLADAGEIFADYHDAQVRNLPCKRLQFDEIWSFVGCNEKNVTPEKKAEGQGDIWTWTSICADTKLIALGYIESKESPSRDHNCQKSRILQPALIARLLDCPRAESRSCN